MHAIMHVLNVVFTKDSGRVAQTALHYAQALARAGVASSTITAPDAAINPALDTLELHRLSFNSWGRYDPLAMLKLWQLAREFGAGAIICHGTRAMTLAKMGLKDRIPILYVQHDDNFKHSIQADYLLCLTKTIALEAELLGMDKTHIHLMPMMVTLPEQLHPHHLYQRPPIIGAMGDMVKENGFDHLLRTASVMNARGLRYQLVIAGEGSALPELTALAEALNISRTVQFVPPPETPQDFFQNIDIFVSPAHVNHIGWMSMQAMAHGLVCITTNTQGALECMHHGENAYIVERNDEQALALAIEHVLSDPSLAADLAAAGQQHMARHYALDAHTIRLQEMLGSLQNEVYNIAA